MQSAAESSQLFAASFSTVGSGVCELNTRAGVGTVASPLDLPVVGQACFVDWFDRTPGGA
jgi:hypothetical protein